MPTAHDREDYMRKHKKTVNISVQQLKDAHPEIFGSASAPVAPPARAIQPDSVLSTMDHDTRGDELLPAAGDVELQRLDGIPSSTLPPHSICAPQGSATIWMLAGTPPPSAGDGCAILRAYTRHACTRARGYGRQLTISSNLCYRADSSRPGIRAAACAAICACA